MLFLAKIFCWLLPHSVFGNILFDLHVDGQTGFYLVSYFISAWWLLELIWPRELVRFLLIIVTRWFVLQHYASRAAHQPVCELLLDHGACANSQTHGGATALHRAAYCGHINIVQLLLKHGADPGLTDDDGSTSLHKVKHDQCLW